MTQTDSEQEFILKVSDEDYQDGLKKGWTDEDMLPPGEHKFRRVSPDRVRPKQNDKARIVVEIDAEILEHFKTRNGESLNTQINNELRAAMDRDKSKVLKENSL
jgi:uncharacterized protein (DUF4415 family)